MKTPWIELGRAQRRKASPVVSYPSTYFAIAVPLSLKMRQLTWSPFPGFIATCWVERTSYRMYSHAGTPYSVPCVSYLRSNWFNII